MDRRMQQQNAIAQNQMLALNVGHGGARIHQSQMQISSDNRAALQQQMHQGSHGHGMSMTPNSNSVINIPVPSSCMRALSNPSASSYNSMMNNSTATTTNNSRSNVPPATPQRSVSHPDAPLQVRAVPITAAPNTQSACMPSTIPIPIPISSAYQQQHGSVASSWQNEAARQKHYMVANRNQAHNVIDMAAYHSQYANQHQPGSLPSAAHVAMLQAMNPSATVVVATQQQQQQGANYASQRSVSATTSPTKSVSSMSLSKRQNASKCESGTSTDAHAHASAAQHHQSATGRHTHRHAHSRSATHHPQMAVTPQSALGDASATALLNGSSFAFSHQAAPRQAQDEVSGQSDSSRGLLKPVALSVNTQLSESSQTRTAANGGLVSGKSPSAASASAAPAITNVVDIPFEQNTNSNTTATAHNAVVSPPSGVSQAQVQPAAGNLHASTWSLGSSASVMTTSSNEERNMQEIRKLRNELLSAQEKVASLTKQLSSNANIVSAFEKNLMVMSTRLQTLSASAAAKDDEVSRLRTMLDGLTASLQSAKDGNHSSTATPPSTTAAESSSSSTTNSGSAQPAPPNDHISIEPRSHAVNNRLSKAMQIGWLKDSLGKAFALKRTSTRAGPHVRSNSHARSGSGSGSVSDFESALHAEGGGFLSECEDDNNRRSDGPSAYLTAPRRGTGSAKQQRASVQNSPLHTASHAQYAHARPPGHSASTSNLEKAEEEIGLLGSDEIRRAILEKDSRLADLQLEALAATQQLAHYRDVISKMRNEISSLKVDNDRLYKITCSSIKSDTLESNHRQKADHADDQSLDAFTSFDRLLGLSNSTEPPSDDPDATLPAVPIEQSKRAQSVQIKVAVSLQQPGAPSSARHSQLGLFSSATYATQAGAFEPFSKGSLRAATCASEVYIGVVSIGRDADWAQLKLQLKALFKTHLSLVDPLTSLGLTTESLNSFVLNEDCMHYFALGNEFDVKCEPLSEVLSRLVSEQPETALNCVLHLRSYAQNGAADLLAFESLIPRTILERYISLLTEHRRVILCGSADTGKSGLAYRLAEYLIRRSGKDVSAQSLVAFQLDQKSAKEVRAYLSQLVSACESQQQAAEQHTLPLADDANASRRSSGSDKLFSSGELPAVILLDNMHNVPNLLDLLNSVLSIKHHRCPYIIGTMNQRSGTPSSLQLHHNFRWILCANHMEPIKGLLSRTLRTRLIDAAVRKWERCVARSEEHEQLVRISSWIVTVWQFVNRLIESYCTVDVTLGPRLFLSCPIDVANSQVWFTNLWNYSLVPYILEAIREGIQTFGRRHATPGWTDPADFIRQTYPWRANELTTEPSSAIFDSRADTLPTDLLGIRPEDIGYFESSKHSLGATRSSALASFSVGSSSPAEAQPDFASGTNSDSQSGFAQPNANTTTTGSALTHGGSSNVADAVAQLLERMQSRVSSLNAAEQKAAAARRGNQYLMTLSAIQSSRNAMTTRGGLQAGATHAQPSESSLSLNTILSRVRGDSTSSSGLSGGTGELNDNLDEYFSNLLKH